MHLSKTVGMESWITIEASTIKMQSAQLFLSALIQFLTSGVKGIGDFLGKAIKGAVTKETAVKPEYVGEGCLVLEPT